MDDNNSVELNANWLALFLELLVLKYGQDGILLIPNIRELLVDAPVKLGIRAQVWGNDLVIQIVPAGDERIQLDDLLQIEEEVEKKETVH